MTRIYDLRGVNYISDVLRGAAAFSDAAGIALRMQALKNELDCRVIRVPYYHDKFIGHEALCIEEMRNITEAADREEIDTWWDYHHWKTSSKAKGGMGFPADWVTTDIEFWKKLLSTNADDLWQKIAAVQSEVVRALDDYSNVVAYELVNEPQFPGTEKIIYDRFATLYGYLSRNIRQLSNKYIVICEGNGIGGAAMQPQFVPLLMPDTERMIYSPHRYILNKMDREVEKVKRWLMGWQAEGKDVRGVAAGEWGVGMADYGGTEPSPENILEMMRQWKTAGFGWTYWAAFGTGRNIFNADLTLNDKGKWLAWAQGNLYPV